MPIIIKTTKNWKAIERETIKAVLLSEDTYETLKKQSSAALLYSSGYKMSRQLLQFMPG